VLAPTSAKADTVTAMTEPAATIGTATAADTPEVTADAPWLAACPLWLDACAECWLLGPAKAEVAVTASSAAVRVAVIFLLRVIVFSCFVNLVHNK